jgi:hypothetical protein
MGDEHAAEKTTTPPLPAPPRRGAPGGLDTLLHVLLLLCALVFLVIMWRRLGDDRTTPSNRDTAFVVVALFVAGALAGWWARGTRR